MGLRYLFGLGLMLIVGVALLGACGGGGCIVAVREALDVRGASNTPCTLTINKGNNLTLDIAAPSPAVADTSLAPRNPPQRSEASIACAGGVEVPVPAGLVAVRTSETLCIDTTNSTPLMDALGTRDCSNVTLTLVCAGTTLYDHVPIDACSCQG